jgi:hypothetical protein
MGKVIRFPPKGRGLPNACAPLLTLFRQLGPVEQLAMVKAAEIVLETRRQLTDSDDSEE